MLVQVQSSPLAVKEIIMKTITFEQLQSVNSSLSERISTLSKQLKEEKHNIKSGYRIVIEQDKDTMTILADNGFDITESIEVSVSDREKILALI